MKVVVLLTALMATVAGAFAVQAQTPVHGGDQAATAAPVDSTAASADSIVCILNGINASSNITVSQPEALTALVSRTVTPVGVAEADNGEAETPAVVATRNGYRVQVFDDNNPGTARAQAERRRLQFESAFPQWRVYVTFNSPYWQVRVGDFRRRGEAEAALAQIRDAMPAVVPYARIVAEKINISE